MKNESNSVLTPMGSFEDAFLKALENSKRDNSVQSDECLLSDYQKSVKPCSEILYPDNKCENCQKENYI